MPLGWTGGSRPALLRRLAVVVVLVVLGAITVLPSRVNVFTSAVAVAHPAGSRIAIALFFDVLDLAAYLLLVPRPRFAPAHVQGSFRPSAVSPTAVAEPPGRIERILRGYVVAGFAVAPVIFGFWIVSVPAVGDVGIWWRTALIVGWTVVPFSIGVRPRRTAYRPGAPPGGSGQAASAS